MWKNTIHNFIIFHVSSHLRWQHFSRASKMQLLALALSILLEKSWCWIIYNVLLLNVDIITIVDIRTLENGWEPQNLRMAKHWYSSMYTLSAQQESQNPPIVWNGKWVHTHPIILKLVIAVHLWQSMGTASGLSGSEEPGIECERLGNQDMPKNGNHQPTQKLPCTSNDQIRWSWIALGGIWNSYHNHGGPASSEKARRLHLTQVLPRAPSSASEVEAVATAMYSPAVSAGHWWGTLDSPAAQGARWSNALSAPSGPK